MQTTFIIICVLMVLVAVAAAAVPLWFGARRPDAEEINRRETVLGILRQQAADLERERADGRIDTDEYEEARMELERRVLEETRQTEEKTVSQGRTAKILALVCAVAIPVAAVCGYMGLGRYNAMDPAFLKLVEDQQRMTQGHSKADMMKSLERLEKRVKEQKDDPNGWYMLANTYAAIDRYDDAYRAFVELDKLVPNNADIIADMADMKAAASGKVITPEVKAMLERALKIDPAQWKALALLAIDAWDRQEYKKAADFWERLLQSVPADFADADQIRQNISEAKRLSGEVDVGATAPGAVEAVPTVTAAPEISVSGTVDVAPELKAKVEPEDVVFVYARPVEGSRMPVAFKRIKAKELPYTFRLTEDMTMATGAATLREAGDVIVGARITRSGNFMPQPGDLEGELEQTAKVGDQGLKIIVNKVR